MPSHICQVYFLFPCVCATSNSVSSVTSGDQFWGWKILEGLKIKFDIFRGTINIFNSKNYLHEPWHWV
jgi:hypothetical protein